MLTGADLRVYLPLRGFADSLNLSVATALVVHHLFLLDPSLEGAMPESERRELREAWFSKLVVNRLMTAKQKKDRTRLKGSVVKLEKLQAIDPAMLNQDQKVALPKLLQKKQELDELEEGILRKAKQAVKPLVDNPPDPITDMRRPDEHRTWFGGKKTKAKYDGVWDNMPATTAYNNHTGFSTAEYFRKQVAN